MRETIGTNAINIISEQLGSQSSKVMGYLVKNGIQCKFRLEIPKNKFYWKLHIYNNKNKKWKYMENFPQYHTLYQYRDRTLINGLIYEMDHSFKDMF